MDLKMALVLLAAFVAVAIAGDPPRFTDTQLHGYCLYTCNAKYNKKGKVLPEELKGCKQFCHDTFSGKPDNAVPDTEKGNKCRQTCDVIFNVENDPFMFPQVNLECHKKCEELYGQR